MAVAQLNDDGQDLVPALPSAAPFLSEHLQWSQVILTPHLRQVTATHIRLFLVLGTFLHGGQHFHLRIACALPARNKMLPSTEPFDPPYYCLTQVPQGFRRAYAVLQDGTVVRPFAMHGGQLFLTLSGIIFTGNSVYLRYVLQRHLVDLGLAGPAAPVLRWSNFDLGEDGQPYLPFELLTALPAELLAVQLPTVSWAFFPL